MANALEPVKFLRPSQVSEDRLGLRRRDALVLVPLIDQDGATHAAGIIGGAERETVEAILDTAPEDQRQSKRNGWFGHFAKSSLDGRLQAIERAFEDGRRRLQAVLVNGTEQSRGTHRLAV